jgi:acyl transferase domain-containing protein
LKGSDCAVYVGISSLDYGTRALDDLALHLEKVAPADAADLYTDTPPTA